MSTKEKLKIFKDKENKYHFKTKDNRHIDIEYKDRRLKFKLHKWNKEASVEAFLNMVEAGTHTFSDNKIEVEDSKKKVRVYSIDTRSTGDFYGDSNDVVQCHDGGLRYELAYMEKPPTNFFDTPLVCRNTRWAKQPFLTQKEIDEGVIRPFNVEGSYAVYHISKKNNEHMTGKMLHCYRPIAIDALGNKAWCDIEVDRPIDPTNIRTTIPPQFLNEATYPIVVDPDFGYTSIGGSWLDIATGNDIDTRRGSAWTMPAPGGTANYIRAYLRSEVADTVDCKAFINQKDSGGAGMHGQIAAGGPNACPPATHWEEFTLAGEALTQAVVYIPNVIGDKADIPVKLDGYQLACDFDGATTIASYAETQTYCGEESPWVVNPEASTRDYSIYINYTRLGWSGKISGVVNPAKIAGVAKADIASVKGVA